jgi:hypothetical protein
MGRQQKITFGEMRASGAVRIIVHCGDYKCGRSVTIYPALWPDNVRLSDLEERFVCTVCGHRGADVRPLFEQANMGQAAQILSRLVPASFRNKYWRARVLGRTLWSITAPSMAFIGDENASSAPAFL